MPSGAGHAGEPARVPLRLEQPVLPIPIRSPAPDAGAERHRRQRRQVHAAGFPHHHPGQPLPRRTDRPGRGSTSCDDGTGHSRRADPHPDARPSDRATGRRPGRSGGMGIGLPLAKKLIEEMGGSLRWPARSASDRSSAFCSRPSDPSLLLRLSPAAEARCGTRSLWMFVIDLFGQGRGQFDQAVGALRLFLDQQFRQRPDTGAQLRLDDLDVGVVPGRRQ